MYTNMCLYTNTFSTYAKQDEDEGNEERAEPPAAKKIKAM